jgi:hypothetical protein
LTKEKENGRPRAQPDYFQLGIGHGELANPIRSVVSIEEMN